MLTQDEKLAIEQAGQLWNTLTRVVGEGATRQADLAELATSIHHIQHAVMSQSAARDYPEDLRLLGGV